MFYINMINYNILDQVKKDFNSIVICKKLSFYNEVTLLYVVTKGFNFYEIIITYVLKYALRYMYSWSMIDDIV